MVAGFSLDLVRIKNNVLIYSSAKSVTIRGDDVIQKRHISTESISLLTINDNNKFFHTDNGQSHTLRFSNPLLIKSLSAYAILADLVQRI